MRVGRVIGDKGLTLASIAMAVYGLTLLLEALVNSFAPARLAVHGRRPQELLSVLVNRGTLVAIPLYTLSYAFLAASHYVSGTAVEGSSRREREYAMIPLFILIFIDYNIIDLIVLAIAAIMVLGRYGSARLPTVLFYAILAASHSLAIGLLIASSSWWIIPASTILRGVAPVALLFSSYK
ncbi:MAG: hypothetical protein F7C33_05360 [Desulfurococcales archaeon]|nr:hypothetical protein [Desulfurococcales archaeon]